MTLDWNRVHAAIWRGHKQYLRPVAQTDPITLADLHGIDSQREALCRNTERFLDRLPANNALLWGARGTGKSSLVKALLNAYRERGLRLIQVDKNDLAHLPEIVDEIRDLPQRYIVFCDDLSFEDDERGYKALKSALEGSIELPPANVLVYATSNRRHLLPEYQEENQGTRIVDGELHYADTVEEKISLADRFGLWLGFHPIDMDRYLAIVDSHFPGHPDRAALHCAARDFALLRGGRSGRTAKQFWQHYTDTPL